MEVHKQLLSKKISNIEHIDLTLQNESFNCNVKSICSLLDEKNKFNYLSLQFFAEGDGEEEGAEGQEYVEEGTEGQEYVEETPSVPMPENSLISIARDKAQEIYDKKSHKKDVGQDTGQEVADKTKGVTKEVKDTAGGDWAKVVSEAKDSVNNKLRKNTSNSGNKNDVKQADKSIENSEGDETYDVATDLASKGVGKLTKAGVNSLGGPAPVAEVLGEGTEKATKKVLESEAGKNTVKVAGLGCLGVLGACVLLLLTTIIILFDFGAEVLAFIFGIFGKIAAGFVWLIFPSIYNLVDGLVDDISFKNMVDDKLEKIYKERETTYTEIDENGNEVQVKNEPDLEFSADLQKNIEKERMKKYVEAELSSIFLITSDDDGDGKADDNGHELEIPKIYQVMAKSERGELKNNFWSNLFASEEERALVFKEKDNVEEYEFGDYSFAVSDDVPDDLQSAINSAISAELPQKSAKTRNRAVMPDNLGDLLAYIPTAEGFFGPLEYSMGNPSIYRGEDVITKKIYESIKTDEYGYIDEANSVLKEETTPQLAQGEVVTGNPPLFKFKLPTFYVLGSNQNIRTDFDSNVTRAFVLDIARLTFDNPKWREGTFKVLKPFTITGIVFVETTEVYEDYIQRGTVSVSYDSDDDGKDDETVEVDYEVPVKCHTIEYRPYMELSKLEMWDKKTERIFEKVVEGPKVEEIMSGDEVIGTRTITVTKYVEKEEEITPSGYADQFIMEYGLESHDFGIYEEITGQEFLSIEDEYMILTNGEYTANFLESGYASPLAQLPTPSSLFGYRTHPVTGEKHSFHHGIDYPAPIGTPLYAVDDGIVTIVDQNHKTYGKYIEIQHTHSDGTKFYTRYAHQNKISVKKGQEVKKGQVIGFVGNTGRSTGPHLHFEVRDAGKNAQNPMKYLSSRPIDMSE